MRRVQIIGFVLLLGVLAGCGGLTEQTGGGSSYDQVDPETLGGQEVVDELGRLYQAAQDGGEDTVVIYGATANEREELYETFQQRFPGITVQAEFLTGPQLTARVNQEVASGNHFADIAHTGSTTQVAFADGGRFAQFTPVSADGLGDRFHDAEGFLHADAAAVFGTLYNSDMVPADQAPQSWNDLLDPRWRGQMAIGDPTSSGAYSGTFGRMLYDGRYDESYFEGLAENGQVIESTQVGNSVMSGEYAIAPSFPLVTFRSDKESGAPIEFVFPVDGGVRESPHFLGLLNDAPHPNAARLLMTWLFTPEGQQGISETGDYPTMPGAPPPGDYPALEELDLLRPVPLGQDAQVYGEALETFQRIFR